MKFLVAIAASSILLAACAPSAVVSRSGVLPAASAPLTEGFVVIKETEAFDAPAQNLGDISIKDPGLAVNCDYETVVALASQEARKLGANVLKIDEHRLPNIWGSSCHRIRARALRVPDVTPYEKEIVWSTTRRLRCEDFKASTAQRPFEAATSSSIRYRYFGRPIQGRAQFTVETYFDCRSSYFKGQQDPARTLAHEQGHFDMTEIAARRFTKAIQERVSTVQELERLGEPMMNQTMLDLQTMHDQYDSEMYPDRSKQAAWLTKIAAELLALQPYAGKQVTLRF